MASRNRFRLWSAIAGGEAISRLLLQVASTAVLARLLLPSDFGLAALVLTNVTIFSVFVGVPFEEALAQRKVLRRRHVQSALGASLAIAAFFVLVSAVLGDIMARIYGQPGIRLLMPAASLLLLPNAALVIATAMARRHRWFNAVAAASLAGNFFGAVLGVVLGLAGAGIWALIGLRVGINIVQAVALVLLVRLPLMPRLSRPHLRDLVGFAGFVLGDRLTENLVYFVFNNAVSSIFGLTVLGHFNMAMRVIEPIRGAVIAILHNLSFSLFKSSVANVPQFSRHVSAALVRSARLTGPIFFGIVAIAPVLIPVLAGPGWENAIGLTELLGFGSVLAAIAQPFMTALMVLGRPQYPFVRSILRLCIITGSLFAMIGLGSIVVGLSRVAGDTSDFLFGLVQCHGASGKVGSGRRPLPLSLPVVLAGIARPLLVSAAMAGVVQLFERLVAGHLGMSLTLILAVGLGAMVYVGLTALIDPVGLDEMIREFLGPGIARRLGRDRPPLETPAR